MYNHNSFTLWPLVRQAFEALQRSSPDVVSRNQTCQSLATATITVMYQEKQKTNFFPSHVGTLGGTDLCFSIPQPDTSWHCETTDTTSHSVPVYSPAFAGTHCTYPQRDSQAELTWVAGCTPTHREIARLRWHGCLVVHLPTERSPTER